MLPEAFTPVGDSRLDPKDILRAQLQADGHCCWAGVVGPAEEAAYPIQVFTHSRPLWPTGFTGMTRVETRSEWFIG